MFFTINFQALPDWLSFEAVLLWVLVGGGGTYIANYVFALLAENWAGWHNLHKAVKFVLPMLTAVGLGFLAQFILAQPDVIGVVQPYWLLVVSILISYLGSQKG
ncbi:MAG: hypothetical protein ACXABD_22060, partial [Candidatus Thorarchaeota archaeon]